MNAVLSMWFYKLAGRVFGVSAIPLAFPVYALAPLNSSRQLFLMWLMIWMVALQLSASLLNSHTSFVWTGFSVHFLH